MEIKIRRISDKYINVEIIDGDTVAEVGIFNENECRVLARQLEEAVDELLSGWYPL